MSAATAPELNVVSVAFRRHRQIHVLIHSFLCQSLQNFKLHVIHDGFDEEMSRILEAYRAERFPPLSYSFTDKRYNDYGHSLREIGIAQTDTEYLLLTNDDNYYAPTFVEAMFDAIHAQKLDIAYCDMVHSHRVWTRPPRLSDRLLRLFGHESPERDTYQPFQTGPRKGGIDIGCVIARTELAKRVGFRDKSHDGDGTYVEDLLKSKRDIRIGKVRKTLFVHN